jgi:peptidyl-prolyl cis-trans isomerase D
MALIGSIRKRTGLLIGFIAFAMLAFLLMDGLSTRSMMGGSGSQNVGKVNGEKIGVQFFDQMYNDYEQRFTTFNPEFVTDEQGRADLRDLVWNEILIDQIYKSNFKDLGLTVTLKELENALYGDNVHPIAKNILTNPETRQFDPNFAFQVIKAVEDGTNTQEQDIAIITHLKKIVKESLLKEKYANLYNSGSFVPDFLAKQAKKNNGINATISYVYFPYTDIADTEIKVTDKELQSYLTKNSKSYEKEASRSVWIYKLDILPSAEDTAFAKADIAKLLEEFKTTENDSIFVRKYSEVDYDVVYLKKEDLLANPNAEAFFTDEVGTFYEPYFSNNAFSVTKLADRKMIPDSVKASHILLPQPQTVEQRDSLQALADSLEEMIKGGADFAALAAIHSTDNSNKDTGGDLDYFKQGDMVKPFNDACFYIYKRGDVFQVPSQFGLHIVKITDATPAVAAVRLANVTRTLAYSKGTAKDLLNKLNEFRIEHDTPEKFEAAAEAKDFNITKVELAANQVTIGNLGQVREIVKWAFTEKVGSIKDFDINDQYVVAYIKSASEKGVQSLEAVRGEITQKVLNQKKAEQIIAKMPEFTNLQDLASKSGKEVETGFALRASFPRLKAGEEPVVAGKILGMKEGSLSKPLQGETGCYVVLLESITVPALEGGDLMAEKNSLKVPFDINAAIEQLKDAAGVKDFRHLFY